nr:MAG TPA: hypothetical protein [Bacteriophage sp.]
MISQLTYYIHDAKVQKICAPPMRVMRRPSLTTNLNSMGDSTMQRYTFIREHAPPRGAVHVTLTKQSI